MLNNFGFYKMFSKFNKLLFYIFIGYPLYGISFLFKRDVNLWVISGPFGFRDNSKYFSIYLAEERKNIRCFWVAKTRTEVLHLKQVGIPVITRWSFRGIYYCLRAKVYIFDSYVTDVNVWTSGGAIKFNLWHGVGIKNIERKARVGVTKKIFSGNQLLKSFIYPAHHIKPDVFLSTSSLMTKHFSEAFAIKENDCIEAIYPRCQTFFWNKNKLREHVQNYEPKETSDFIDMLQSYQNSYIYMPTWRDSHNDFLKMADINLYKLDELMRSINGIFIFKLHPNTKLDINLSEFTNLVLLPNRVDVYPLLPYIQTLITDYSSIYYDFILMKDKQIILFPFDYQSYVSTDRDLAYDYFEYTHGDIVYSFEGLLLQLEKNIYDISIERLDAMRDVFWSSPDNHNDYIYTKLIEKTVV